MQHALRARRSGTHAIYIDATTPFDAACDVRSDGVRPSLLFKLLEHDDLLHGVSAYICEIA